MNSIEPKKMDYAIVRCDDGNIVGRFDCNNSDRVLITAKSGSLLIRKLSLNESVIARETLRELVKQMLD